MMKLNAQVTQHILIVGCAVFAAYLLIDYCNTLNILVLKNVLSDTHPREKYSLLSSDSDQNISSLQNVLEMMQHFSFQSENYILTIVGLASCRVVVGSWIIFFISTVEKVMMTIMVSSKTGKDSRDLESANNQWQASSLSWNNPLFPGS